ncbi:hypothetical protein CYMTET_44731 [Cymbomonas tetramitiformis]|uniref:AMP-dependent synthetase/ligase domain-containing protein n=1 Tax=Cymbomonas tetramitiformis TaxID=36881 RepID=A0AAE0C0U3_9CHLO|nr:hypothetical protein CYMTET_44731 [Cymbomonas tetramitiformis]
MYSSGTTGGSAPKGIVTSKAAWGVSNANPGARLGFTRAGGGVAQFVEHARQLKPSFVLGMATLWSDLYEWHVAALNLALQQSLRERWPDVDIPIDSPEWSRITSAFLATRRGGAIRVRLLRQSRQDLGGCLQVVATGGSRTPSEVLKFMAHVLQEGCASVKDCYGSTEFPGISTNGIVAEDVELKLEEAAETKGGGRADNDAGSGSGGCGERGGGCTAYVDAGGSSGG